MPVFQSRFPRLSGIALAAVLLPAPATAFPVTVDNCGRAITVDRAPQRAVSHDLNISEIMFALELQPHMVGLTGITGWYDPTPAFLAAMGDLPELASRYPTMENLLSVDPDFFFAGWYYGMRPGDAVTPDSLAEYGITTYVLTESCIHVDETRPPVSMDTLYEDVRNIGTLFGRVDRAEALIVSWGERIAAVAAAVEGAPRPRVFLYDSGDESPFTSGRYAMPTALIEAAGGKNIMDDVATSWGRVGWESVVERDPELIILINYQDTSAEERRAFLEAFPAMADVTAVREGRYLVLEYTEITPGPSNIAAVEALAAALHPDRID